MLETKKKKRYDRDLKILNVKDKIMKAKLLKAPLLAALLCGLPLVAMDKTAKVPKDKFFVGAGLSLGGLGYSLGGLTAHAGYIHYFPKDTFIEGKLRQGIRAYGSVSYGYGSNTSLYSKWSYHYIPVIVGADYLLDLNPGEKFVWGLFAGAGVGFVSLTTNYDWNGTFPYETNSSDFGIAYSVRAGGSLTIENKHRLDLTLGYGYSYLNLYYSLLF